MAGWAPVAFTAPVADWAPVAFTAPVTGWAPVAGLAPVAGGTAAGGAAACVPDAGPAVAADGGAPAEAGPASGTQPAASPATGTQPAAGAAKASSASGGGVGKAARGPRRARLQLRHIDTFSALKISLVLSIAMFFIWMVAVGVLYGVLSGLGVFDTLNDLFGQLGTASGADGRSEVITPGIVFGGAAVIGAINIVLMTALCTVAAFIYNMCSDLVGGLEVTLSERD